MVATLSKDDSIGRSEALQMSMIDLMTDKNHPYYRILHFGPIQPYW